MFPEKLYIFTGQEITKPAADDFPSLIPQNAQPGLVHFKQTAVRVKGLVGNGRSVEKIPETLLPFPGFTKSLTQSSDLTYQICLRSAVVGTAVARIAGAVIHLLSTLHNSMGNAAMKSYLFGSMYP